MPRNVNPGGRASAASSRKPPKMKPKPGRSQQRNAGPGVRSSTSFAASAYATGQRTREPSVTANGRSTRIRHRELVATVTGTTSFGVFSSLALNPGIAATFPWLSSQASGWEQYRFHKLCFEYYTRSATTATGSVILAPDYDSLDAAPASEATATSYRDSTEDAPWKDQVTELDSTAMHPIGPRKYVRAALVANSDLKTYDAGKMHVCTTGQADTSGVGKLWVSYDVELFVPQLDSSNSTNNTMALFNLSSNQSLTTGTTATLAVDESVVNDVGVVNSSGTLTLPAGNWEIRADVSTAGATGTNVSTLLLELEKDDAALSPPAQANSRAGTNADLFVSVLGYVVSDGTNTVRCRVTYTCAAGTLVASGDRCRILARVV